MASVKTRAAGSVEPGVDSDAPVAPAETFKFTLANGTVIVCGKPRGVLKLKMRDILPPELLEDNVISSMAQAFLSIRSVDGAPLWLRNYNHFEAFCNRFRDDEELDAFMEKYNELVNPEMMETVRQAIADAKEQRLKPAEIEDFIVGRVMELNDKQKQKVRD